MRSRDLPAFSIVPQPLRYRMPLFRYVQALKRNDTPGGDMCSDLELTSVFANVASFCSSQRTVQRGNTYLQLGNTAVAKTSKVKRGAIWIRRRREQQKGKEEQEEENQRVQTEE
jgi:hypothetical protein